MAAGGKRRRKNRFIKIQRGEGDTLNREHNLKGSLQGGGGRKYNEEAGSFTELGKKAGAERVSKNGNK